MRTYEITVAEVENGWYSRVHCHVTTFGVDADGQDNPAKYFTPRSGVFADRESALLWVEDVIKDTDQ